MRKLIMWNLLTLDGMFEGPKSWDLDWHQGVWGPELERISIEQLHTADMLLFGRTTYEGMAAHWQTAQGEIADLMNQLPKVVFSRTLASADWSNTRHIKGNAVQTTIRLKQEGSGNLFVFGSANLSSAFIQHSLFDEYRLALAPVVLGRGKPLFKPNQDRLKLRLIETQTLSTGCVILRYEPKEHL